MNEKIKNIENRLEKLKKEYPNLTDIWKLYIDVKKNSLEKSLLECEKVLDKIETTNHNDLSKNTIYLMYLLTNSI